MANAFQQNQDKLKEALNDTENYHSSLEHGADLLEECLGRFKFKSLKEYDEWAKKPIDFNFDYVKGRALEILIICEKDKMAEEITKNLDINNNYKPGWYRVSHRASNKKSLKGYSFTREFYGNDANIWVTSTFGHLNKQTFPEKVDEEKMEEILYAKIIDVSCSGKEYYPEVFEKFGHRCDMVIEALDNDEEGEAIAFECTEMLMGTVTMPPSGFIMDAFYRARFSSAPEIVTAMENLERPNFRIYLSMVFKHHLDLRSGVALSRVQRFVAEHYLPEIFIRALSFRPCGSICVKLIVDRYDEVLKAVPKYCLEFDIDFNGKSCVFCCGEYSKEKAEKLCEKLKKTETCEIIEITKSDPIIEKSPPGLNSFELLKFLSRYLFINSTVAAESAQRLYELGLISYPRSETTKYGSNLTINIEQLHSNLMTLTLKYAKNLTFHYQNIHSNFREIDAQKALDKGMDMKDHPPITPTYQPLLDIKKLNKNDAIIYEFIVRRFLAVFAEDYSYRKHTIKFKIGKEKFEYLYFTTENLGFTKFLPELIKEGTIDDSLSVNVGDKFKFDVNIKKRPSRPYLEEYELIQQMEENHIGTDGSIPKHIEAIEYADLVEINDETFEFYPLLLGRLMTNAYRQCISQLVNPKFRAKFIRDVNDIANGKKDFVKTYQKNLKEIDKNFQQLFKTFYLYFGEHVNEFRGCFNDDYNYNSYEFDGNL